MSETAPNVVYINATAQQTVPDGKAHMPITIARSANVVEK